MDVKAYHDLFTATAGIFAAFWVVFIAMAVFMAQQRATTGAKLTFATSITPARAMIGNAYFFAGMEISLVQLYPNATQHVRLYGELFTLTFAYAPLAMLMVTAHLGGRSAIDAFKGQAPFYIVTTIPLWGTLWFAADKAATIVFSLLGFGCLWTFISVMFMVFFANEWSPSAAHAASPEKMQKLLDTMRDVHEALKKRSEQLQQQTDAMDEQTRLLEDQGDLMVRILKKMKDSNADIQRKR